MSHEAHHYTQHQPADTKPTTSFRSSIWLVIILAGLFIAAVNFVNIMGHDEGEGHGGHGTEARNTEAVTTHEANHEMGAATPVTADTTAQHVEEATTESATAEHH